MDNEKPLDEIQKNVVVGFGKLSFRFLLITITCFFLFIGLALFNPSSDFLYFLMLILLFGFITSSIVGFIYSIRSIIKKEPDTIYKTIGVIGNILFLIVLLGVLTFVVSDIVTWF